jgi:hypothetical protein
MVILYSSNRIDWQNSPSLPYFLVWKKGKKEGGKKGSGGAQGLWLTPIILPTQEAEIRKIMNGGQPWTNSS